MKGGAIKTPDWADAAKSERYDHLLELAPTLSQDLSISSDTNAPRSVLWPTQLLTQQPNSSPASVQGRGRHAARVSTADCMTAPRIVFGDLQAALAINDPYAEIARN